MHKTGYCVQLSTCLAIRKSIWNPTRAELSKFVSEHRCGPKNENSNDPKVCCSVKLSEEAEPKKGESIFSYVSIFLTLHGHFSRLNSLILIFDKFQ